jgi:glutathione synthase/RimK-type ligase-like ATP-grasp enzyme
VLQIITEPGDGHAIILEMAMRDAGICVERTSSSELLKNLSFEVGFSTRGEYHAGKGCVWLRRKLIPDIEIEGSFCDVSKFYNERKSFLEYHYLRLDDADMTINSYANLLRARNKLYQLNIAQKAGFETPCSFSSMNEREILDFIKGNETCVFKSFNQLFWSSGDKIYAMYCKEVSSEIVKNSPLLEVCAHIYQSKINSVYEVRCVFFGENYRAAKLTIKSNNESYVDIKKYSYNELSFEKYSLPDAIKEKCISLMSQLNIETASFDFLVDENNIHHFIELNEAGQFLFLEQQNGEITTLDLATKYFLKRLNVTDDENINTFTLTTYDERAKNQINSELAVKSIIPIKY